MTTTNENPDVMVAFASEVYGALEKLAADTGKPPSVVLGDAISHEQYIVKLQREGGQLLVRDPDGTVRQVSFT